MAVEGAQAIPHRATSLRSPSGLLLALALLAAGCQRDEVAHFRVPKESTVPAAIEPAAMAGAAPAEGGLRWTLPAGWKDAAGGGSMRYATLTAPVAGKLEVTVIRLPGPAGGELANVNRWRNQLGLAPIAEAELPGAREVLNTPAGALHVYDFASAAKKSRTIAGLTQIQGETWFVKMTGDAEAVQKARAAFLDLLGSLHLEAR